MGYTNETAHYGLPLPLGSDKTTPMDYNTSLEAVDTALFGAVSDCASFDTRLDTAEGNISTAQGDITNLDTRLGTAEGKISTLEGTATSQGNEIKDVRSDCEDMITAYNEASATSTHAYSVGDYFIYNDVLYKATNAIAIGDTIVPDTNCTTTNVTTEINQINTALSDKASTASVTAINDDLYSAGVALISANISSTQDLTPSQAFTNFNTIKVRIGAYYSAQDRNLYMQAFDIDLRHLVGSGDEFIYSWYQTTTNFMTVEFGIVSGKLQINAIQLGTDTAQNFAVYVEAYGYKQTL